MRRAALIYNPTSGSKRQDRARRIATASDVLQAAGIDVLRIETLGQATAGAQARAAIDAGCDTVIACGGDGTVHEVLQGVVGTQAALGVIPLGTANSLACDLGIPRDPRRAAEMLLRAEARRIAAGKLEYRDCSGATQSRYFTVTAGIGADAHLAHQLNTEFKRRHGMSAYYAKAVQLWMTHPFPAFEAEFFDKSIGRNRTEIVTELLAIRITDFGGVLRRMAPRAALRRDDLELVLFKSRSRISYLRFVVGNMMGRCTTAADIEFVASDMVKCRPLGSVESVPPVHAEADGEGLGVLPAGISVLPQAFTLLMPSHAGQI